MSQRLPRARVQPLSSVAQALIRAYQQHLSPRKGYGCALRLMRGRGSGCSGVGLRLIRRYGILTGLLLLRRRLQRCAQAARQQRRFLPHTQRGDCDCGLDGCADIDAGDMKKCASSNRCLHLSDCMPDPSCDGLRLRPRTERLLESQLRALLLLLGLHALALA